MPTPKINYTRLDARAQSGEIAPLLCCCKSEKRRTGAQPFDSVDLFLMNTAAFPVFLPYRPRQINGTENSEKTRSIDVIIRLLLVPNNNI